MAASDTRIIYVAKRPMKSPRRLVEATTGSRSEKAIEKSNGEKPLAKSIDPEFMKFTTYIRKTTHLGVKTRLVSRQEEISDLVEELLSHWLKENESFKA